MDVYIKWTIFVTAAIVVLCHFNPLVKWIKPTFEDGGGSASYKRLTAFALLTTDFYMVYNNKIVDSFTMYTHFSLLAAFLVTAVIITIESLVRLIKAVRGIKDDPKILREGDNVILEKE